MIARHWRGIARAAAADAYLDHLRDETFPALRRDVPLGVEFLIVTNWESLEAIRAFAGEDVETAVVPPVVHGLMAEFDTHARHYEVVL